jgi:hypothetical protein
MEERLEGTAVPGEARPEALHVYGVDLVGTSDLLNFFQKYGALYVEWINDSSCNILFPDEFAVQRLLVQMGEVLSNEEAMQTDGPPCCFYRLWGKFLRLLCNYQVSLPKTLTQLVRYLARLRYTLCCHLLAFSQTGQRLLVQMGRWWTSSCCPTRRQCGLTSALLPFRQLATPYLHAVSTLD